MTEKAIEYLKKSGGDLVMRFRDHKAHVEGSLYEYFILRGIRVDELEPRFISCSFKVPPRLTDEDGRLRMGAVVSLVDEIGAAVIHQHGSPPMDVSVDMSISYISPANSNDELEIEGRLLGSCDCENGGLFGTSILIRNKVTGEVIAQGRHTLFRKSVPVSKM